MNSDSFREVITVHILYTYIVNTPLLSFCLNSAANMSDDEDTFQVESLQRLTARVLINQGGMDGIYDELTNLVTAEREAFELRRNELQRELEGLDEEEKQTIQEKKNAFLYEREEVQHFLHTGIIGFCRENDHFYEHTKTCSVAGCEHYLKCACETELEDDGHDEFRNDTYMKTEEQNGWVSGAWLGSKECWICKKELCATHFCEHYDECRKTVSYRCGFRPPTLGNLFEGFVCVEGHCGRDVRELGFFDF